MVRQEKNSIKENISEKVLITKTLKKISGGEIP